MAQRKNSSSFIYSYLPFSDDRIQFLDIRGWDGQAIKLNREFYINFLRNKTIIYSDFSEEKIKDIKNEIVERTEDVDGIYTLLGEDMKGKDDGICYIGETADFKRRMSQHFRGKTVEEPLSINSTEDFNYEKSKEFCSEIFFFSQRGKLGGAGLGESLRKGIEAKVIKAAKNSKKYHITNRMSTYKGKLKDGCKIQ